MKTLRVQYGSLAALFFLLASSHVSAQDNSVLLPANSQVRIADAAQLGITGTLTLEAWIFQVAKIDDWSVIVSKDRDALSEPWVSVYGLTLDNGPEGQQHAHFEISNGVNHASIVSPATIPLFTWVHLAAVYTGDTLKLYINGTLNAQSAATMAIGTSNGAMTIGRRNLAASNMFRGFIDEVRVWNVVRTAEQIQSNRTQALASNDRTGLVGYWMFNQPLGTTTAYDSSGFNDNGTIRAGAQLAAFAPTTVGTPQISITPTSLNFGLQEQGETKTDSVSITNTGTGVLVGYVKNSGGAVGVNTHLFWVTQGVSSKIPISIRPLIAGPYSDFVNIPNNAGAARTVQVSGASIALNRFDGNNIGMWALRDGRFAYNPIAVVAGLEWPLGSGKTSVYESGVWVGATVNGQVRMATAEYGSGFTPGPIINRQAADPANSRYRVYKIKAGDNSSNSIDYAQWPSDLGAPTNPDGSPLLLGEQTLWAVYNDADTLSHWRLSTNAPLGAEVQQTTFGYKDPFSPLGNVVFLQFKVINKSSNIWQNAYLGLWADPDLGNYFDDFVATDTTRSLGICYNADNDDDVAINNGYGTSPPALGYMFLQAGGASPLNSFVSYFSGNADTSQSDPLTPDQAYNFLRGLKRFGSPFINQVTNQPTKYTLSGDPVTGTGWLDALPGDRRFLMSTGPFNLATGESRIIFAAVIMARGSSNIESIVELRQTSDVVRHVFESGLFNAPQIFSVKDVPFDQGGKVTLAWKASVLDRDTRILPYYSVWRAIPFSLAPSGRAITPQELTESFDGHAIRMSSVNGQNYAWEWMANVPSHRFAMYSYTARTNYDSMSTTNGKHYFMVSAHTADPNIFFDSPIDSGYSVDNIPPLGVGGIAASVQNRQTLLHWSPNPDPDVDQYLVYRSLTPNIDPKSIQPLAMVRDTVYIDASPPNADAIYYAVLARDIHENVGPKSAEIVVRTTGVVEVAGQIAKEYFLSQNYPNPFNPATTIPFGVPQASHVSIKIYNTLGQEMETMIDQELAAGSYIIRWNGNTLPSGIYLYRLTAGQFVQTKKLLLMK